ncbi:hypothetical protein MFIFM68171_04086 [Madurella fahalii]|uniref:Uncharacterized protein n=1 Tax=Madurella fahalii TaxID=1157608 RepID=A0ABQ0G801_9PEZI
MVGYANHASAVKGSTRTRPSGLRVKTNVLGIATPDGKARAIASTGWRETASGTPSSDTTVKRNTVTTAKHSSVESGGLCPSLAVEMEKLPSDRIQYRRPREKQAAWETVLSAPAGQLPSSPPSTPGLDPNEVTMIRLKQVNPLVMNVNGEDIPLPNRFYFEVMPVDPGTSRVCEPPGASLGELKKLKVSTSFQHMPSECSYNLLDRLQEALVFGQDSSSTVTSAFANDQRLSGRTTLFDSKDSSSSASSAVPLVEGNADHARTKPSMEEEARFQGMLSRLQKKVPPPPVIKQANGMQISSSRINDPAIVAIKVKEKADTPGRKNDSGMPEGPANHVSEQYPRDVRRATEELFSRPGISVANDDPKTAPFSQRSNERSTGCSQTKGLNPTAAEFRSTIRDGIPCFLPKKISRAPLSNIFPGAMPNHIPPHPGIPLEILHPELPQQTVGVAVEGKPTPCSLVSLEAQLAASQAMLPPLGFGTSVNGTFPGTLSPIDALIRPTTSMPFSATLSGTTTPANHLLPTNFGTYPSATISNASINVPHLSVPTAASLMNTFPPVSGTAPVPTLLAAIPCGPEPQQQQQGQQPQQQPPLLPQPLVGPPGQTNNARPFFPVMQKPRDHDPVKQQLYEAYLEWRKANEPGYHMKCKMRQAHRVVRQFQKKQQHHQQQHHQHQHHQQRGDESNNNSGGSNNDNRSGESSGDSETAA